MRRTVEFPVHSDRDEPAGMTGEEFCLGVAVALPEAFEGVDAQQEYRARAPSPSSGSELGTEDEHWMPYIACARAKTWLATDALAIDFVMKSARVRPGREDAVRRFFEFIETAFARSRGGLRQGTIVCLFEATPWIEDLSEYLGPCTLEALRQAQGRNLIRPVGRWE